MGSVSNSVADNPKAVKETLQGGDDTLQYGVCHMRGWRRFMEDATLEEKDSSANGHHLFGVFDGHGGPEVAQFVQKHFHQELINNQEFKQGHYGKALIENFHKMDDLLRSDTGKKEIEKLVDKNVREKNRLEFLNDTNAGTTANVCMITDSTVIVANAGDSRCVACCRGRTVPLSYDHKPTDEPERARIKRAGGFVARKRVNGILGTSRSIGDLSLKKDGDPREQAVSATPDVIHCRREGLDFILLGCDGIWTRKSNEQMVDWIKQRLQRQMEPSAILAELFDEELTKDESGKCSTDNMSAILVVFNK